MTDAAVRHPPPDAAVHRRPGERPVQHWRRLLQSKLLRQVSFMLGFGFGCAIRVAWDEDALQVVLVGGQVLLTLAFVIVKVGSKAVLQHALDDQTSAGVIVLLVGSGLLLGHSL